MAQGRKTGGGSRKGRPNKAKTEIGEWARNIIESEAYQNMFRKRAIAGTLPTGVEAMLFHYAYGKPPERVEVGNADGVPFRVEMVKYDDSDSV